MEPARGDLATDPRPGRREPEPSRLGSDTAGAARGAGFLARNAPPYALLLGLLLTIVVFSVLRPDSFPTLDNLKSMLGQAVPLLVVAMGLTVALVAGEFDLSLAGMIGLGGAAAVVLMAQDGLPWPVAVFIVLLLGAGIGLLNGLLVAYGAASSFIITLGMGTICTGIEFLFTGQKTIFDGIPASYASLGQGHPFLDLPWTVFAAVALAVGVWIVLDHTEYGRRLLAVGGSEEAARLAGLRTRRLRASAFVVSAVFAALAGIAVTSAASSSTPQAGLPYLLPAFAAVFLGSAVFRVGQFNAAGTIVGVVLLQVIQTGLLMLSLSTALINIIQGTILIAAILLSRFSLKAV